MARRSARGGTGLRGSESTLEGIRSVRNVPDVSKDPIDDSEPCTWRLWFAVRLGPWRKVGKGVAARKVRRMEMPPGPNGSRGNPFGHAKWVAEWREASWTMAKAAGYPPMQRVRLSAVFRRRALGTADEDNDRARLKPLVDGLRDAKVIPNDTRGYVEWGEVTEEHAGPEGPGVLLIVEALESCPTDRRSQAARGDE